MSAALSGIRGEDVGEVAEWRAAAERLAPYPMVKTTNGMGWVDVAGAPPIEYNIPVPLSPVFWGDHVGLDSPPETLALAWRTLEQIRVWEPALRLPGCVHSAVPGAAPERCHTQSRELPAVLSKSSPVSCNSAR